MRRTLTLCRTALAGAAVAVLLTACGGGSSDNSAATSSAKTTTSSSSSSSSAAAADSDFCKQAATLDTDLAGLSNTSDLSQLAPALQTVSQRLHQLTPPPEIANDWNSLVGAVDQLAQAAATTDFTNQQQATAFAQKASQLESQLGPAATNVENYLSSQCGIGNSTESASPTS